MSLREMAQASGVSASMLSQLERGASTPTIQTLRRVAAALDVSVFQLIEDASQVTHPVVRPDRRRKIVIQDDQLTYELLSPDTKGKLEVWLGRLGPGGASGPDPSTHASEEFILVQEGRMEIDIAGVKYELAKGDSIQYDGMLPHRIESVGDEELVFVSALTPPTL